MDSEPVSDPIGAHSTARSYRCALHGINKSTMTEYPGVIDLISLTSDADDDCSLSSDDLYHFQQVNLGVDEHGQVFVKEKNIEVIIIDDDETTLYDMSSQTSSLSLSDDTWYRKRATRPSKQQHYLFTPRCVSSRLFLASSAIVVHKRSINRVG